MDPESELFYRDFVSSGILSVATLNHVVAERKPSDPPGVNGMFLEINDKNNVTVATVRFDRMESRSHVTVGFAGYKFVVAIDDLRADLIQTQSPEA